MEIQIVIVSCKGCVFAENAEGIVLRSLDLINKGDVGNISLRVQSFDLRELGHNVVAVTIRKAKVQIIVITHAFLDELKNSGRKNFCQVHLNRVLHSKGVICILMKIDSQDVLRNYTNLLPHFMDWNILELRANKKVDPNFTKSFQEFVIQSYNGRAKYNESKIPHPRLDTVFWTTVSPSNEDSDTAGIASSSNVKPLLLSTRSDEGTETITVKLNEPVGPSDVLRIQLRKGDDIYSTTVQIPDNLSPASSEGSIVKIEAPFLLFSGQNLLNEGDPIDHMFSKFPGYKQYLDDHLSHAIEQVNSLGSNIENLTLLQEFLDGRDELLPTVLHFAAYYGLKETVVTLMASEDGLKFVEILNFHGESPLQMAVRRGHDSTIGQIFREYEGLIYTWEAIKRVTHCKDTASRSTSISIGSPQSPQTPQPISKEQTVSILQDAQPSGTEDDPAFDPDDPDDSHEEYVNIEVVPPDLPDRKIIHGNYCYPSPHVRTIYDVPPSPVPAVLIGKGPIPIEPNDNYVPVYKGPDHKPGDTWNRLNKNPIRASFLLGSSSTEEEEEPWAVPKVPTTPEPTTERPTYNVPVPEVPSASGGGEGKPRPFDLDPLDKELQEILKAAVTEDWTEDQLEYKFKMWKSSPGTLANGEESDRRLEQMREEYHEMQNRVKRDNKEIGLFDRVVHGIRKATKKMSNAGIRSSGESTSSDDKLPTPPISSRKNSPEFNYPFTLSTTFVTHRRISSNLMNVLEENEHGSPDVSRRRRKRITAIDLDNAGHSLLLNNEKPKITTADSNLPESGEYVFIPEGVTEQTMVNRISATSACAKALAESGSSVAIKLTIAPENVHEDPPPPPPRRPPKKNQLNKGDLEGQPATQATSKELSPELSDAERRQRIPPKPARRNIENVQYINYRDKGANTQK